MVRRLYRQSRCKRKPKLSTRYKRAQDQKTLPFGEGLGGAYIEAEAFTFSIP